MPSHERVNSGKYFLIIPYSMCGILVNTTIVIFLIFQSSIFSYESFLFSGSY